MQFQVPQFIDVEDKIFGPFSFKQFLYLVGGAGLAYVLYKFLPLYLAILPIIIILALAGALTYYPINGRPFITALQSGFSFLFSSKLYVWKKDALKKKVKPVAEESTVPTYIPKLSESKLHDLSWSLDVLESKK